jgi:hypothetical protein
VAGAARRRRQLRCHTVPGIELPELQPDRCTLLARQPARHVGLSASVASARRCIVRSVGRQKVSHPPRTGRPLAGMDSLGRGEPRRDRLEHVQDCTEVRSEDLVASLAQRRVHHALPDALQRDLGFPAARDRQRDIARRNSHCARAGLRLRCFCRSGRTDPKTKPPHHRDGRSHRRTRVPHELFGHELHARSAATPRGMRSSATCRSSPHIS